MAHLFHCSFNAIMLLYSVCTHVSHHVIFDHIPFHPGGTKRATSVNLLRACRARRGNSRLAKSSPYAGPSAGKEVARLTEVARLVPSGHRQVFSFEGNPVWANVATAVARTGLPVATEWGIEERRMIYYTSRVL